VEEKRRRFDAEFRKGRSGGAAAGEPIAQIARDLGVNKGTLGNWVVKDVSSEPTRSVVIPS
jgi:transposase